MGASAVPAHVALGRPSVSAPLLRLRSDEQLVTQFRAGNDDAFAVIHDRYRARLGAYARRMLAGSQADAEDVLQDVFLRAYRALRADQRPISLRAWLYRVAHNRCIDEIRRPVPIASEVVDTSRGPCLDPCAESEQREDLRRLVADLRRLPDQQRSALLMREIDGMSYAELAAALDTSVPAIKSLLVRARLSLVDAAVARDTDCDAIRLDLADAHERGVRANARARRHLRECSCCSIYRTQLTGVRRGLTALSPAAGSPLLLGKLLGVFGLGGGAAAGGGGGAAVVGGGAVVGVGKVAAIVCCAAAVTGGAIEARHVTISHARHPVAAHNAATAASAEVSTPVALARWTSGVGSTEAAAPVANETEPDMPLPWGGAIAPAAPAPAAMPAPEIVAPLAAAPPAVAETPAAAADVPAPPAAEPEPSIGSAPLPNAGDSTSPEAADDGVVPAPTDSAAAAEDHQPAATDTPAADVPATPPPAQETGGAPAPVSSSPPS